jgi:tetratricopeptide (TPR) repeat protein
MRLTFRLMYRPMCRRSYRTISRYALGFLFVLACAGEASAAGPAEPHGAPLLAAPPPPPLPGPPRSAEADAATYENCMTAARAEPDAGHKHAQDWQERGGGHPADHCLAVALIGLQQYKEAATRLETLGQAMVRAPAALRAEVFGQAGQAWLLAGNPERAYAANSAALTLRPDDPELLLDRAQAAGSAGWYDKAIADLDQVLKADPARVDALIYRASAHRAQDRLDRAWADVSAALVLASESVPALLERGNIRRLLGDADGARQDWRRVAALAPGSAAATAAIANIERLKTGDEPARPSEPTANR